MRIRRATLADSERLIEWRNDPLTRAMSRNTGIVGVDWARDYLTRANRLYYIVERDGLPIATAHFDLESDAAEISITVAPEHRGRGLAVLVIDAAIAAMQAEWPAVHEVVAQIKPGNVRSIRCFERAGFERTAEGDLQHYRLKR